MCAKGLGNLHPKLGESSSPDVQHQQCQWNGLCIGLRAYPAERIAALNAAITKALQSPEVQAALASAGVVATAASAQQTTDFVAKDVARWQALAKKANLVLD